MSDSRKAYIYFSGQNLEEITNVLEMYEQNTVIQLNNNLLELSIEEELSIESLSHARDVIMGELLQDITVFVLPKNFSFKTDELLKILPKLNRGIYLIENLIYELVKLNDCHLLEKLRSYYYNKVGTETIETILGFIDQDLNASKTAKALYMHRNTLNYRLDNFITKTEINVRTFSGAMAMYLLFRY